MEVTGVDNQQVHAHATSFVLHVVGETDVVTPVGATGLTVRGLQRKFDNGRSLVLLLKVTSQPAMGVGLPHISVHIDSSAMVSQTTLTVCRKLSWPHSSAALGP
jgi:hypothetical protein